MGWVEEVCDVAKQREKTSTEGLAWTRGFTEALLALQSEALDREVDVRLDAASEAGVIPDGLSDLGFDPDNFMENGMRRTTRRALRRLAEIEAAPADEKNDEG